MFKVACIFAILATASGAADKVLVEDFFIGSCGTCAGFSHNFSEKILALDGMKDIIDLQQTPVGHYLNETQGGPYMYCRHGGWYECELHAHYLCAKKMSNNDSYAMFDFVECANAAMGAQSDPGNFPLTTAVDVMKNCATKLKYNWEKLTECTKTDAEQLEIAAAAHGYNRGIHFAPTVFVSGKEVSGQTGVDIKAMLKTICDDYKGTKPAACSAASIAAMSFDNETYTYQEPCQV